MCQPYCVLNGLLISFSLSASSCFSNSRHEGAGACPAQITAICRRAGILGRDRGNGSKVFAAIQYPVTDVIEPLFDRLIVLQLVGREQDMACVNLRHYGLLRAAACFIQPEQVETARRADRFGNVAGLHLADLLGHDGRQLRALTPAQ